MGIVGARHTTELNHKIKLKTHEEGSPAQKVAPQAGQKGAHYARMGVTTGGTQKTFKKQRTPTGWP